MEPQNPAGGVTDPAEQPPTLAEIQAERDKLRADLDLAKKADAERAKKLADYERAEKARRDAELSEADRLKQQAAEKDTALTNAQIALRNERIAHAVQLQALALDFHDTADALALLNIDEIEIGDDGRPDKASVRKALEKLAKAKPHLVASANQPANGSPPGRRGTPRPAPDRGDDADREVLAQARTGRYLF